MICGLERRSSSFFGEGGKIYIYIYIRKSFLTLLSICFFFFFKNCVLFDFSIFSCFHFEKHSLICDFLFLIFHVYTASRQQSNTATATVTFHSHSHLDLDLTLTFSTVTFHSHSLTLTLTLTFNPSLPLKPLTLKAKRHHGINCAPSSFCRRFSDRMPHRLPDRRGAPRL